MENRECQNWVLCLSLQPRDTLRSLEVHCRFLEVVIPLLPWLSEEQLGPEGEGGRRGSLQEGDKLEEQP